MDIKCIYLECSGGNKRKLSTAVALVGNPPIVLLVGLSPCYVYIQFLGSLMTHWLSNYITHSHYSCTLIIHILLFTEG